MTAISTNQLASLKQSLKRYEARLHRLEAEREEFLKRIDKLATVEKKSRGHGLRSRKKTLGDQLIAAIKAQNPRAIRKLLQDGANPNTLDRESTPAIVLAASFQRPLQMLRALLRAGADANATDQQGNAPLIILARDEDLDCVKELIKHGADVNAKNIDGDTPFTNSATWGAVKVVRYLLSHSADPMLRDGAGLTALDLAGQHGHKHIAELLR
jgi:ankyrin repeat protein